MLLQWWTNEWWKSSRNKIVEWDHRVFEGSQSWENSHSSCWWISMWSWLYDCVLHADSKDNGGWNALTWSFSDAAIPLYGNSQCYEPTGRFVVEKRWQTADSEKKQVSRRRVELFARLLLPHLKILSLSFARVSNEDPSCELSKTVWEKKRI